MRFKPKRKAKQAETEDETGQKRKNDRRDSQIIYRNQSHEDTKKSESR